MSSLMSANVWLCSSSQAAIRARVPDLHPVERADHDHVAVEAGVLLEQRRDRDPPLLVGLVLAWPASPGTGRTHAPGGR